MLVCSLHVAGLASAEDHVYLGQPIGYPVIQIADAGSTNFGEVPTFSDIQVMETGCAVPSQEREQTASSLARNNSCSHVSDKLISEVDEMVVEGAHVQQGLSAQSSFLVVS